MTNPTVPLADLATIDKASAILASSDKLAVAALTNQIAVLFSRLRPAEVDHAINPN